VIENFFNHISSKHVNEQLVSFQNVGGGCINNTAKLATESISVFVKWNAKSEEDLFQKEEQGLDLLRNKSDLIVPEILGKGVYQDKAYLLLEWIESGHANSDFWDKFGIGLARVHRHSSQSFGLSHDNYIGRLHQSNSSRDNWSDFFIHERLEPQIRLALDKRLIDANLVKKFEQFYQKIESIVPNEKPSLLHGDLWSGNFLTNHESHPVLIDPAVYYGHRETELAFTALFGGFDQRFYQAYDQEFSLAPGFRERIDIHNLYPLLVHVNLFGSSYLSGIIQTLKRFQ